VWVTACLGLDNGQNSRRFGKLRTVVQNTLPLINALCPIVMSGTFMVGASALLLWLEVCWCRDQDWCLVPKQQGQGQGEKHRTGEAVFHGAPSDDCLNYTSALMTTAQAYFWIRREESHKMLWRNRSSGYGVGKEKVPVRPEAPRTYLSIITFLFCYIFCTYHLFVAAFAARGVSDVTHRPMWSDSGGNVLGAEHSLAEIPRAMIKKHVELIEQAVAKACRSVPAELFYGPYFCAEQDPRCTNWLSLFPDGPTSRLCRDCGPDHMAIIVPVYEQELSRLYSTPRPL